MPEYSGAEDLGALRIQCAWRQNMARSKVAGMKHQRVADKARANEAELEDLSARVIQRRLKAKYDNDKEKEVASPESTTAPAPAKNETPTPNQQQEKTAEEEVLGDAEKKELTESFNSAAVPSTETSAVKVSIVEDTQRGEEVQPTAGSSRPELVPQKEAPAVVQETPVVAEKKPVPRRRRPSEATPAEVALPRTQLVPELENQIRKTFLAFASFGIKGGATVIDGSKFAKLCRDCNLIDRKTKGKEFYVIDVDITFNKTLKKGDRKVGFEQFRDTALQLIAGKRQMSVEEVASLMSQCSGPVLTKTPTPSSTSDKAKKAELAAQAATPVPVAVQKRSKTSSPPSRRLSQVKKTAVVGSDDEDSAASPMLLKLAMAAEEADGSTGGSVTVSTLGKLSYAAGGELEPRNGGASPQQRRKMVSPMIDAILSDAEGKSEQLAATTRSVEESMEIVKRMGEERDKLRKNRKAFEKERKRKECEEADRIVADRRRGDEAAKADRERNMAERLEQLRQRKEARELEFLVGERRAREVLHRRTLNDKFEEDYSRRVEADEEERRHQLEVRRAKLRAPVAVGIEEAEKMLKENELKKSRRALEVQAQLEYAEATTPAHWHGSSYLRATEEYVRNKAVTEDQKHSAMYRHAKMQEFGKLVKHIANDRGHVPLPYPQARLSPLPHSAGNGGGGFSPTPAMGQGGRQTAPLSVSKEALSHKDRHKQGNNFLKQAIKEKAPLPAGLKLNPLMKQEEDRLQKERAQFKARKKQGDQFLRDLRESTGHAQPKPLEDVKDYLADIRKLRAKANSMENKLAIKGLDMDMMNSTMELQSKTSYEMVGEVDDVLECVRTKMLLLERIDKFEHPEAAGRNLRRKKSCFPTPRRK